MMQLYAAVDRPDPSRTRKIIHLGPADIHARIHHIYFVTGKLTEVGAPVTK